MIVPSEVDVARELSGSLGPSAAGKVLPLVLPAVVLVDDPAGTSVANPRPRLPDTAWWPSRRGQPMLPLLDLDLAAVQRLVADPLLPADGRLLVLADSSGEEPMPGGWSVEDAGSGVLVHVASTASTSAVEAPAGDAGGAVRLGVRPGWSLPPLERRTRAALTGDDDAIWAYYKLYQALSIAHPLRWGQIFGQVDDEDTDAVQVGRLAAAAWQDWSLAGSGRWRPALTVATELEDNAELTFWLCTGVALPQRLQQSWMTVFSG
jgi:hypothetical protein